MNATMMGYLLLVVGASLVAASVARLLTAVEDWTVDSSDSID